MEKKLYQSPTMYVVGIRLATGICSGVNPPTTPDAGGSGSGGVWEAPKRA